MIWLELPTTSASVTRWLLVTSTAYLIVRETVRKVRRHRAAADISATSVSDALLFGTSVLLLCGAWNAETMRALGDTSAFLVFAGLVGISGAIRAIFRK